MSRKGMETSKVIILVSGIVFAIHILMSVVLIYTGYGESAVSLITSTVPVYLAVVAGYFGKAGFENVSKIKSQPETTKDTKKIIG